MKWRVIVVKRWLKVYMYWCWWPDLVGDDWSWVVVTVAGDGGGGRIRWWWWSELVVAGYIYYIVLPATYKSDTFNPTLMMLVFTNDTRDTTSVMWSWRW